MLIKIQKSDAFPIDASVAEVGSNITTDRLLAWRYCVYLNSIGRRVTVCSSVNHWSCADWAVDLYPRTDVEVITYDIIKNVPIYKELMELDEKQLINIHMGYFLNGDTFRNLALKHIGEVAV